jgi:fatty-acyl-CoA synthase
MLLHEIIELNAIRIPNKEAVVFHDERLSYMDINEKAGRIAAGLIKLGVNPGDRVALLIGNKPEIILIAFACWKIGACILPINYYYTNPEIKYILENSESSTLVLAQKFLKYNYLERLGDLTSGISHLKRTILIGDQEHPQAISLSSILEVSLDPKSKELIRKRMLSVKKDDISFLIYTGGTTGFPKGVLVTHEARYSVDKSWTDVLKVTQEERIFLPMPLFHLLPWHAVIGAFIKGATVILAEAFDPEESLKSIQKERVTFLLGVPTMYLYLAAAPGIEKYDLSSLRIGLTGGAVFPENRFEETEKKLGGFKLLNNYGLTEAGGCVNTMRIDDSKAVAYKTIGRPIPGFKVKITDDGRKEVPVGKEGEITVWAPWIRGYYNNPEANKEALDEEGWLYTGDLGRLDAEGYITYVGRKKEMFITGGNNIYPAEIEIVLQKHSKVAEVVVLPIPHPTLGEVGRAYVIPKEGQVITNEELIKFCIDKLASIKIPKHFVIRDKLPLTPVGKVNKKVLEEEIKEEFKIAE